jgi:hypothetical protein
MRRIWSACGRVENDPIAALHAIADLDRGAAIANHGELSDVKGAFLDGSDPQAVRTEQDGFGRNYQRLGFAGNLIAYRILPVPLSHSGEN